MWLNPSQQNPWSNADMYRVLRRLDFGRSPKTMHGAKVSLLNLSSPNTERTTRIAVCSLRSRSSPKEERRETRCWVFGREAKAAKLCRDTDVALGQPNYGTGVPCFAIAVANGCRIRVVLCGRSCLDCCHACFGVPSAVYEEVDGCMLC